MARTENILVKFARLGETPQEVIMEAGATTVADFRGEHFDGEPVKVKRGGVVLEDDDELHNGDLLIIANKVEGGC